MRRFVFGIFLCSALLILSLILSRFIDFTGKVPHVTVELDPGLTNQQIIQSITPSPSLAATPSSVVIRRPVVSENTNHRIVILKDVGEAFMDHFGLTDYDFEIISKAGFNVIEGNFDICATDEDVKYFLNTSEKYGLKVIMPAGSGEAEWGFPCNENFSDEQKPRWQKDKVVAWMNKWKTYKNIWAWDTSNEAGSVFPSSDKPGSMLSSEQLKVAYADVKSVDSSRKVMIRMNGWFFYDYDRDFFRYGNPFARKVADVVMVNSYSNVDTYFSDFVATLVKRSVNSVTEIDSGIEFVFALGVWGESPIWHIPPINNLRNDYDSIPKKSNIIGIGYFKYGAKNSEWYLPKNAPSLWSEVSMVNKEFATN